MSKTKFLVSVDNREKAEYRYVFHESFDCAGSVPATLSTGDYAIFGMEDQLCIERKKSVSELSTNLHEDRFYRELERMKDYRLAFLLLEFSLEELLSYPEGSNLPPKIKGKIKVTGPYLLKKVTAIMTKYPYVQFLFCGSQYNAYLTCLAIMKRVHESTK